MTLLSEGAARLQNLASQFGNAVEPLVPGTAGGQLRNLASQLGKAALHHLHPDEFEYYAMALELCDSRGEQVAYLLLPVMPESITISGKPLSTLTKTQAGLVRLVNPSYTAEDISISGSFGRRLRLLVRKGSVDLGSALVRDDALGQHRAGGKASAGEAWQSAKTGAAAARQVTKSFSYLLRTGYGTCKLLEKLLRAARQPDDFGQPHRLFLYNLAFNYHVLVEEVGFTFTQNIGKNMIWDYQLALRALAPASAVQGRLGVRGKQVLAMTADLVQRAATVATNIALDVAQRAQAQL